jgi:hypothetical protein
VRSRTGGGCPDRRVPWSRTVLTVVSGVARIRITLLPARPSRLKATSMPRARKNVCAPRKRPGIFGPPGPNPRDAIVTAIAADTQEVGGATSPGAALGHERTKAANGSASMASSTAALPLAGWARANVPTGQIEVSQAAAQKAKSAISEAADRPRNCGRIVGRRKSCGGKSSWSGPVCSARRAPRCLVVTRPDLADRGLFVSLRPIAETQAGASLKH